jgi:hypothetical protein
MYTPRHHHWAGPVAVIAFGFAVYNRFPGLDVALLVHAPLDFIAGAWAVYLLKAGLLYQEGETKMLAGLDAEQAQRNTKFAEAARSTIPTPKLNLFRQGGGMEVLSQAVTMPKLDKEREIARILNDQRVGGMKMDISETFWIRNGHWKDTPEGFRAIRNKWEYYKIVGKRGAASNSPYSIQNEQAVELIATGKLRLPTPPGMA